MNEKLENGLVIAIDMDGTLCFGECWDSNDCILARPNLEMIKRVNQLALTKFILIYTARRDDLIPATLHWLRENNVIFHAISNNKSPADCYLDDKSISFEDFLEE